MQTLNNIHLQFASFFKSQTLQPFAYLVSKKLSEGHICLNLDEAFIDQDEDLSYFNYSDFDIEKLKKEKMVSNIDGEKQPFILHKNRLYLQRYFNYESQILEKIHQFIANEKEDLEHRFLAIQSNAAFIKSLFPSNLNQLNWQLAAAVNSYLNDFTIITGGPGTGKTTTVAKILAILFHQNPNLKVSLAAPTGKAAARMAESLKSANLEVDEFIKSKFQSLKPSTIHRLLGYIPDSPYFKHNQENPLTDDVLIIDESSMIDVALFAKLLTAVGTNTKLILLGDKDQLASVEAGSLFGDLCIAQEKINVFSRERTDLINNLIENEINKIPSSLYQNHALFEHIIELQYSHRFNSEEGIGKFSKAIIQNNQEEIKSFIHQNLDRRVLIDKDYSPPIFNDFIKGYEDYIQEKEIKTALKKFNQLRILCAIREGEQGLFMVNKKVEKHLSEKKLIQLDLEFYEHRPIIMNSNNYALGLFNGDIGLIRKDENGILKAYFEDAEGELIAVLPGLLSKVETVFAMTIHKSQGSEFDQVLVILPQTEGINILTRELLYTGITRAKSKVILQGSENVILQASAEKVKRASGIHQRFLDL